MHTYLIEMLECPVCHSELDWTITEQSENRAEQAEARCAACAATYPVRDGIGLFLTWDSQIEYLLDLVSEMDGTLVDLASGRRYLVEKLAQRLKRPIVATDFSPSVLRRDRKSLEFLGLYDNISLLAFDARRTPFKDGVIQVLTTNLGLPNVEEPGRLLEELRRVVGGTLLAITHFFPEDDDPNRQVILEAGLEPLLYRHAALDQFTQAGWDVEVKNACECVARPTPPSDVIEGARADGLPVADTTLEWCVLLATGKV